MKASPEILSADQRARFRADGVLVIPGFYDAERDILPIQSGIHQVIGQVMKRHGLAGTRPPFHPERFDDGYRTLIERDRAFGGEVYDAVKQLPAFIRLLGDRRHEALFRELRPGAIPGVAAGGYGIRIDNPGEDRFRAEWHQEYPAQLRSVDGLVYWSPLRAVTEALGPVRVCLGSHASGPLPVVNDAAHGRAGAYALRLKDEEQLLGRFTHAAPLTVPGDLIIMDFLTVHASGHNRSHQSRWSMQFRFFNFDEPTGLSHGWRGSFASGVDFRSIHPELFSET